MRGAPDGRRQQERRGIYASDVSNSSFTDVFPVRPAASAADFNWEQVPNGREFGPSQARRASPVARSPPPKKHR